jgi:curved DNA-binding protein CbpA
MVGVIWNRIVTSKTDTTGDYYRLLGISSEATRDEVRAAYRSKVSLWHPDLAVSETEEARQTATEMTARLNEAYECLRDPNRRSAYDTIRRADRHASTAVLVVSPRTLRCDVTPGDTVHLTLNVRADNPPGGSRVQVRASERMVTAEVTATAVTANSARFEMRVDTSKLSAHRIYQVPIEMTWGNLTGTATLVVRTTKLRQTDSTPRSRRKPTSSSRRNRTRPSDHRMRDLLTISLGGIVLPLLMLAWTSGLLSVPTPANPSLVTAICVGVVVATTWLLTSSRLLRRPDRLAPIGVVWGHLMRWFGWALVGGCAILLGIPAVALTLMIVVATPTLGFIVVASIVGRFDSQRR